MIWRWLPFLPLEQINWISNLSYRFAPVCTLCFHLNQIAQIQCNAHTKQSNFLINDGQKWWNEFHSIQKKANWFHNFLKCEEWMLVWNWFTFWMILIFITKNQNEEKNIDIMQMSVCVACPKSMLVCSNGHPPLPPSPPPHPFETDKSNDYRNLLNNRIELENSFHIQIFWILFEFYLNSFAAHKHGDGSTHFGISSRLENQTKNLFVICHIMRRKME